MALSLPTAVGQKATEGNVNYISVADGTKFVWLIDADVVNLPINHLAIADTALVARLNVYPSGSDLTAHVAPTVVAKQEYAIAEALSSTTFGNVRSYIANSAGDAWLQKTDSASKGTLHDFGLATAIDITSANHEFELHLESNGKGYAFDTADLADGDSFRIINTSTIDYTEAATFTGFTKVFERVGGSVYEIGVLTGGTQTVTTINTNVVPNSNLVGETFTVSTISVEMLTVNVNALIPDNIITALSTINPGDTIAFTSANFNITGTYPANLTFAKIGVGLMTATATAIGATPAPSIGGTYTAYAVSTVLGTPATPLLFDLKKSDWRQITITLNGTDWYANITGGNEDAAGRVKAWAANEEIKAGTMRIQTMSDGTNVFIVSNSTRTTGAALNVAELGNWTYYRQDYVRDFPPTSPVIKGYQISHDNIYYQSDSTRLTGATFNAAEELIWQGTSTKPVIATLDLFPTAGSTNSVESQGILSHFTQLRADISTILGVPLSDGDLNDFPGTVIPDNGTIKADLAALEAVVQNLKIAGRFIGVSATFATLPTTNTSTGAAVNSDYAILSQSDIGTGTALNPQYQAGYYIYDGTKYVFSSAISGSFVQLLDGQYQSTTDTTFGLVSGKLAYDRDQALKGLASAFTTNNANYAIAKVWDAATLLAMLTPAIYDDVNALRAVDTTNVANQVEAYIKSTKELVVYDKAAATGDYSPVAGGGFWQKSGGTISTGVVGDFANNATNTTLAQIWSAVTLQDGLLPIIYADVAALKAVNTLNLIDRTNAYIRSTKEYVVFEKAAALGDYQPTSGGGFWQKTGSVTKGTLHDLAVVPATPLVSDNFGYEAHFEGGGGYSLDADTSSDGDMYYLLNTSSADAVGKFTFTNFTGVILRSGSTEATITSPYTIKKGTKYLASVTVNGANKYLNLVTYGGASEETVQTINATGNVTEWTSLVIIGATAPTANITLTLPTAAGNIGKKITFLRVDNTDFTVTLAAQAAQTLTLTNSGSELRKQFQSIIVEVATATEIRQVANSLKTYGGTLHDLGVVPVTALTTLNNNAEVHFEGGGGYSIDATQFNDGELVYLLNTSGADANNKFTFSNFAGSFLRSGTNETSITSPFTIKKGMKFLASITVNGANRFLNLCALTGSTNSVTVQTGSHAFNQTSTTNPSSSFAVTFPSAFANPPTVELTYQWNYNATTNGTALSPPVFIDGTPTTTGFNYRINGNRNALDRVLWTAVDPLATVDAGNTVLTPRAITGSVTSVGYDGITLPYVIPLAAGQILDTVFINAITTTDFDPNTGIVRITPSGSPILLTHTTKTGATYSGLQFVSRYSTQISFSDGVQQTIPFNFTKGEYLFLRMITGGVRGNYWLKLTQVAGEVHLMSYGTGSTLQLTIDDHALGKIKFTDVNSAVDVELMELWTNGLNKVVVPMATTVLTPRNITGSVTSTGYDGVDLPYQIPLAAGLVLDTVSLNGTATTNFDANTGIVRIQPSGGSVAVTHTTKAGATFNGLQRAMVSTTELALTAALQTYTLPATLMEGDLLEVQHQYNGGIAERQSVWVRVQAGSTQRNFPWADATNNTHYWVFPATLNNTFQVRQATANSSPRILSVKVWRDAANGFCIPTGTTVATAYTVTINGGANGTFTGYEGIGPETFYLDNMPVDQEINAFPVVSGVTLRNRQAGMISVDRAVGGGNLALTGITFRNLGVKTKYFGTADNQAGDSTATNGGHTFTQRLARGNGIATSNHSTFTLAGGIYRIRFGVTQHYLANAWRNTGLLVNGTEVNSHYSGSDGSNWESGGDLEWIVDAISTSQTVQMRRVGSSNNGNCDCWLSIEREEGFALPEGYVTRDACVLTTASGSFIGGATTANVPTNTGQYVGFTIPNGQILQSVTSNNADVVLGAVDPRAGSVFVTVGNGATAATLTPTFAPATPARMLVQVNAGVSATLGSLRFQVATSGNRSLMVASATGSNCVLRIQNLWEGGGDGNGLSNVTALPGSFVYTRAGGWNFTTQGNHQYCAIEDTTNNRFYHVMMEVGGSYNNNTLSGWEIA